MFVCSCSLLGFVLSKEEPAASQIRQGQQPGTSKFKWSCDQSHVMIDDFLTYFRRVGGLVSWTLRPVCHIMKNVICVPSNHFFFHPSLEHMT